MGLAEASLSRIYIGKTLIEGTEPTTYQTLTPTGHTLEGAAQTLRGEDIRSDRKPSAVFRTQLGGRGDINLHWRPSDLDAMVETVLASEFGAAVSATITATFAAPDAQGLQMITDDGSTGALGPLEIGDVVLVTGAVDAENNGLRRVFAAPANNITVYNPEGVASVSDPGVGVDHNGVTSIGATKIFQWCERVFSDGTNDIYSEWYQDLLGGSWSLSFAAAQASRCAFNFQGDAPTFVHADGAAPITEQRGGSDVPETTERLVHSMDDLREVILYEPTLGAIRLVAGTGANRTCRLSAGDFQVTNNIRQDASAGCADVINTALGDATLGGSLSAYVDDAVNQSTNIAQFLADDPDNLALHLIWGATDSTAYGAWFQDVRFESAPVPVGGNNQAVTLNSRFNATDIRVTRI